MKAKNKILEWLVSSIFNIVLSLALPSGLVLVLALKDIILELFSTIDIILLLIIFVGIIYIVSKMIWKKFSWRAYHYPRSFMRTSSNYEVQSKRIVYSRQDDDSLSYSREKNIKCLSNRLGAINDKYIWTGPVGTNVVIQGEEGISNIKNISRIGIWQYVEIQFDNHMMKGEEKTVKYSWKGIVSCSNSSPFFSASTEEPTKKLELVIMLGKKYKGQTIICEEFRAIESDFFISREERILDENGSFTWKIPHIKRFRYYRIRWSWEVGKKAPEID